MKSSLAAAILAIAVATPAAAGPVQIFGNWMERAGKAQRHFLASNDPAPISAHCRAVIANPKKYGQKEVKFCKGQ